MILKRYFSLVNSLTINEYFFKTTEILKFYNMKKYEFLNRILDKFSLMVHVHIILCNHL